MKMLLFFSIVAVFARGAELSVMSLFNVEKYLQFYDKYRGMETRITWLIILIFLTRSAKLM